MSDRNFDITRRNMALVGYIYILMWTSSVLKSKFIINLHVSIELFLHIGDVIITRVNYNFNHVNQNIADPPTLCLCVRVTI